MIKDSNLIVEEYLSGLNLPVMIDFIDDDDGVHMLVIEKDEGTVKIIKDGIIYAIIIKSDYKPKKTEFITKASRLVSSITGFSVQPNKAIVGANAFAHEAGIHQDGMLKHSGTYEIMTPDSVGLTKSTLVLGKHSGKHAFNEKLKELGYDFGDNAIMELFGR